MSAPNMFSDISVKRSSLLGVFIWAFGLVFSMVLFTLLGIDVANSETQFGPSHEKYIVFEAVLIPSFFVFSSIILVKYFRSNEIVANQALAIGVIIMIVQFLLDLIVMIGLLKSSFSYFIGLVTVTYLLIPFICYGLAKRFS